MRRCFRIDHANDCQSSSLDHHLISQKAIKKNRSVISRCALKVKTSLSSIIQIINLLADCMDGILVVNR